MKSFFPAAHLGVSIVATILGTSDNRRERSHWSIRVLGQLVASSISARIFSESFPSPQGRFVPPRNDFASKSLRFHFTSHLKTFKTTAVPRNHRDFWQLKQQNKFQFRIASSCSSLPWPSSCRRRGRRSGALSRRSPCHPRSPS